MRYALAAVALLACLASAPVPARAGPAADDEGYELYLRGEFDRAGDAFRRAAERGDPAAQYMLGTLYALGQGVQRDAVKAHRWLSLAAGQGDPLALLLLATVAGGDAGDAPPEPAAKPDEPGAVAAAAAPPPAARHRAAPPAQEAPPSTPDDAASPAPRHHVVMASLPPPAAAERFRSPFDAAAGVTTTPIAPDMALARVTPVPARDAPDPAAAAGGGASVAPAAVAGIQRRLAALGYDPGPADGAAGARTRIAIRAFQRDTGLEIDGVPSPALEAALAAAAGGDGLVAAIQDRLGQLGFAAGPADGVLRDATRRAMLDYYRAAGVAGVLTLDGLVRRLDADLAAARAAAAAGPAPRRLAAWIAPPEGAGATGGPVIGAEAAAEPMATAGRSRSGAP